MKSVVRNAAIFTVFSGSFWIGDMAVDHLLRRPAVAPPWESPSARSVSAQGLMVSDPAAHSKTTPASAGNALAADLSNQ